MMTAHTHTAVVDIHREQRLGKGGELSLLFAHLLTFFIIHSSARYVTFAFHLYLWLVEIVILAPAYFSPRENWHKNTS